MGSKILNLVEKTHELCFKVVKNIIFVTFDTLIVFKTDIETWKNTIDYAKLTRQLSY